MIDPERIREAAREVLSRPEYDDLDRSVLAEWLEQLRTWVADALATALGSAAAGGVGRLIAFGVVVLVVVGAVVLLLGMRRGGTVEELVEVATHLDAATLLTAAAEARDRGDLETAVRSRYGALVLVLVEAGVLVARPGLTVGEVDEAARVGVPTAARAVAVAGRALADVVYGDLPATVAADEEVVDGLAAVARATGRRDLVGARAVVRS